MSKSYTISVLLSLLLVLCAIGCALDDGNPGSSSPPLQLQVTPNLSLLNLSWTPVNVTGFKEYVILQSTQDIPDAPTPTLNPNVSVLTRINEVNVTTFSTTNTLLSPNICYKLYCSVGDRFLYSPTVCVSSEVRVLEGFYERIGSEQDLPELVMFDRLTSQLIAYDYKNNVITHQVTENQILFPFLDIQTYGGVTKLYTFDQSSGTVRRYSYPQLLFQAQRPLVETVIAGVAGGPFLYVASQNTNSGFTVLDRTTFALLDFRPSSTNTRNLAAFPGDTSIVLDIGDSQISRFEINASGKVIKTNVNSTGVIQLSAQNTCDIGSKYYIGGRFSTIVNRDGEVITSLVSGVNNFTPIARFSNDETKAFIINSDNATSTLEIYDITSLPNAPKLKSYPLPILSFSEVFQDADTIYVIGISFVSSPQTIILQFPI